MSTRSTKKVNKEAHEHLNLKVHIYLAIQLPSNLSTIIKACICPSIQLHERFGLEGIDISSIKCVHMWLKNKSYLGVTLNLYVAFKHERIQAIDHESIQSCDH